MWKYILILVVLCLAALGLYIYNLSGPQKLDFADRWYPGGKDEIGTVTLGQEFGKDAQQKLDIYTPKAKGPHPVLIFFHGGSWYHGEREGYAFIGRKFAARGYVTIIADYRKYPDVKFPAFTQDVADAVDWTHKNIAQYGGKPDSLYLMGHSAGAHISMLATLDPQWLAAKNLDDSIIKGVIGLAGPYDFLPFEKDGAAEKAMGDWPKLEETQPIHYARGDAPPILLLHGATDQLVGRHNNVNLESAIKKAGGKISYKLYDNVDHYEIIMAFAQPFRDKAPAIEDVTKFMKIHQ